MRLITENCIKNKLSQHPLRVCEESPHPDARVRTHTHACVHTKWKICIIQNYNIKRISKKTITVKVKTQAV